MVTKLKLQLPEFVLPNFFKKVACKGNSFNSLVQLNRNKDVLG